MISFLKLIRYKNLLMVLLTMVLTKYALIDTLIKESYQSNLEFFFLVFSVILITAGGYIINDIYDLETDKINKPNKVFIGNVISIKKSWISYFLLTVIGLFIGVYLSIINLNKTTLLLFLLASIFLFLYSKYLKKHLLIGNLVISFLVALPIFIIFSLSDSFMGDLSKDNQNNYYLLNIAIYLFLTFAFLTTLIREIIKDIEDVNGDLKMNAKTLPIVFGRKRASKVAFFFTCILLVFLISVLKFVKNEYLLLVYGIIFILLPLLSFMHRLWNAKNKKDFSKLSNLLKIIMLFGILSMLLFRII